MPPSTLVELGGDRRSSCALNNFNFILSQHICNHVKIITVNVVVFFFFYFLLKQISMLPSHTLKILPQSSLLAYLRVFF